MSDRSEGTAYLTSVKIYRNPRYQNEVDLTQTHGIVLVESIFSINCSDSTGHVGPFDNVRTKDRTLLVR